MNIASAPFSSLSNSVVASPTVWVNFYKNSVSGEVILPDSISVTEIFSNNLSKESTSCPVSWKVTAKIPPGLYIVQYLMNRVDLNLRKRVYSPFNCSLATGRVIIFILGFSESLWWVSTIYTLVWPSISDGMT